MDGRARAGVWVGGTVVVMVAVGAGTAAVRHQSEHSTSAHHSASSTDRASASSLPSRPPAAAPTRGPDGWIHRPLRSAAFPGRYTQLTVRGRWAKTHASQIEQASALAHTMLSSYGFELPGGYRIEYAGIVPEDRRGPLLASLRMLGARSSTRLVDVAGTHVRLAVKATGGSELAPAFPPGLTRLAGPTDVAAGLQEFEYLGPKLTSAQLEQLRANIAKAAHRPRQAVLAGP